MVSDLIVLALILTVMVMFVDGVFSCGGLTCRKCTVFVASYV